MSNREYPYTIEEKKDALNYSTGWVERLLNEAVNKRDIVFEKMLREELDRRMALKMKSLFN
jgi:hypothetical protein